MFRVFLVSVMLVTASLAKAETNSAGVQVSLTIGGHVAAMPSAVGSVYTRAAAAITLRKAGFRRITFLRKRNDIYYYSAMKQRRLYWIAVTVRAGRIMRAKRLK